MKRVENEVTWKHACPYTATRSRRIFWSWACRTMGPTRKMLPIGIEICGPSYHGRQAAHGPQNEVGLDRVWESWAQVPWLSMCQPFRNFPICWGVPLSSRGPRRVRQKKQKMRGHNWGCGSPGHENSERFRRILGGFGQIWARLGRLRVFLVGQVLGSFKWFWRFLGGFSGYWALLFGEGEWKSEPSLGHTASIRTCKL